jgi:dihydroorotate dehydrogenase
MDMMAITNSFGMPSMSLEYLKEDIPRANSQLQEGQVMIVSVVGTPSHTNDKSLDYTNFVKDFTEVALFAKNCGASIVEANFSCPNVISGKSLCFA